jgi:TatD DNase family protein
VVFCGFGEPMMRPEVVRDLAMWVKEQGVKTRLNTNGLADEIHGQPTLNMIAPYLDSVSISLNAETAEKYVNICRPPKGKQSYEAVLKFIEDAVACIPDVTATIVSLPGVDTEACRKIAETLGAKFRVRDYNVVG